MCLLVLAMMLGFWVFALWVCLSGVLVVVMGGLGCFPVICEDI